MASTVFALSGNLSVVQSNPADVGTSIDELIVNMLEVHTSRAASKATGTYTYFIKVNADLNNLITYKGSETGNNNDDAWSFAGFSCTNATAVSPVLYFPTASNVNVSAGTIEADNLANGSTVKIQDFPVDLSISLDDQAMMSATITVSGNAVYAYVNDSSLLAQTAYWDLTGTTPTVPAPSAPTATAADILGAEITNALIDARFKPQLDAVKAFYNGHNMITSWSIALDAVASSTTNVLSDYARFKSNAGNKNVFSADEIVMAVTPFSYEVKIKDYTGTNEVTIKSASNVYGLVKQTTA